MKERKQAIFSVRMDQETKTQFDAICNAMGITSAAAINMFCKQVVLEGGMPFRPTTRINCDKQEFHDAIEKARAYVFGDLNDDAIKSGAAGMTMEEINAEIELYRKEKREKEAQKALNNKQ